MNKQELIKELVEQEIEFYYNFEDLIEERKNEDKKQAHTSLTIKDNGVSNDLVSQNKEVLKDDR